MLQSVDVRPGNSCSHFATMRKVGQKRKQLYIEDSRALGMQRNTARALIKLCLIARLYWPAYTFLSI